MTIAQAGMIALTFIMFCAAMSTRDDNESGCLFFLAVCLGLTTFLFWSVP